MTLRVLFVDDDRELLETLADQWGLDCDVSTAPGGEAGLAMLALVAPDVVVSDMRMPGMDGATFLAKVRQRAPDTVRILLTGQADLEAAIRAVNDGGVFRFLTKPCKTGQMAAALSDAAAERKLDARLLQTERLATLGTMSATLGHEMNNSLTLLQVAIDQVVSDARESRFPEPEVTELLLAGKNRLIAQSTGALRLAGRSERKVTEVSIGPVLRELGDVMRSSGTLKHAVLELQLPPEDRHVTADRTEIEQIFVNLVKNAADAVQPRGAKGRVSVVVGGDEDRVQIIVRDNGSGIAPDKLARVFEPYFTTKPVGVGTGLGLPVVKQLVESYRGSVTLESELDRGTTFTIELPASRPRVA